MGRKPRLEEEGGIYHVIQRGNNREYIFNDDMDKDYLIGQFCLLCGITGCHVYGFVIMGNHYHLVLKTSTEPLQSVMHRLNLRYSKYYNREHEHTGHVFQGRYKAIPVSDERYILSLVRYLHQNPVRAGICKRVEEYRWSSDSFYRENNNDWVDTDLVLDILSDNRKTSVKEYIDFMSDEEGGDYESIDVIGDILESRSAVIREGEKSGLENLDNILLATGVNEQDFNQIKNGSRKRNLTVYKRAYAEEALKLNYTMKAIGENIKVSDVAILDLLRRNNLIT
jgi:REP element-mobilizing transposase RayT